MLPVDDAKETDNYLIAVASIARSIHALFDDIPQPAQVKADPEVTSIHLSLVIVLPSPLTSHLLALGLKRLVAECLSRSYLRAATRLKTQVEQHFRQVYRACVDATLKNGSTIPDSLMLLRTFYENHFSNTVQTWAKSGLAMTRERLMHASLKARLSALLPPQTKLPTTPPPPSHNTSQGGFLRWSTSHPYTFKHIPTATDAQGKHLFKNYFKAFALPLTPDSRRSSTPSTSSRVSSPRSVRKVSPRSSPSPLRHSTLSLVGDPFISRLHPYAFPTPFITEQAKARRRAFTARSQDLAVPVLCRGLRRASDSSEPPDVDGLVSHLAQIRIHDEEISQGRSTSPEVSVKTEPVLPPIGFPLSFFPVSIPEAPLETGLVFSGSSAEDVKKHGSRSPAPAVSPPSSLPTPQPEVRRRKIAPIPKRISRGLPKTEPPTDTHLPTSRDFVSLDSVPPAPLAKASVQSAPGLPSVPEGAGPSQTPPRPRKVAPLPKRRSAVSTRTVPLPSESASPDRKTPIPPASFMPVTSPFESAPTTPISRTPSLTDSDNSPSSLSSRSSSISSWSSSSSKLLTPPSSPSTFPTALHHPVSTSAHPFSRLPIQHPSIFEAPPSPYRFGSTGYIDGSRAAEMDLPGIVEDLFPPDGATVGKGKAVNREIVPSDEFG